MAAQRWLFTATVLALILAAWHGPAAAADGAGTKGGALFKIGIDARAIGMGEAYSAVTDDVSSIYWNPAGLGKVGKFELMLMHTEWFLDLRYEYVAFAYPLGSIGTLGAAIGYLDMGDISETTIAQPDGTGRTLANADKSLAVGYAYPISEDLIVGANAKILISTLAEEDVFTTTQTEIGADVGVLYRPPVPGLMLGAVIQNVSTTMGIAVRVGGAYDLLGESLRIAADASYAFDDGLSVKIGGEYKVVDALVLRGGYTLSLDGADVTGLSGIAVGIGFLLGEHALDLAWVPYGNELGHTVRASFLFRF